MFAEVVQDAESGMWHGRLDVSFQDSSTGQPACHNAYLQTQALPAYAKKVVCAQAQI